MTLDRQRRNLKRASRGVHAGERPEPRDFIPVTTPIYPTSSFVYRDLDRMDEALGGAEGVYAYTRYGNPTLEAMEIAIASLEEQDAALGFGSGMAAVNAAILTNVQAGDRILASRDIYGATTTLLSNIYMTLGVPTTFVDIIDIETVAEKMESIKPRLVICETISNPLLRVTAIDKLVELCRTHGALLIVDNTFATPLLFPTGQHGVDIAVHSSTKYLGGHGDVTAGVAATSAERRMELNEINKATGSLLGPFEAWLVLRGIKTMSLRVEKQCKNAAIIADWLQHHPKLQWVYFPGLPNHESHDTAKRLLSEGQYGGMVSFELKNGTREQAFDFMRALEMIVPATTLGDVHSLVLYPPMSSHRALSPDQRREVGISDGLIRLSVGIEDPSDIINDLERGLAAVS
jgi:cystathionine beta-lyase/cystathionine gamma-synthase